LFDLLNDKIESKEIKEKFIEYLLQAKIRIVLTNKKIEDRLMKKLFDNFILVIDMMRIEEINLLKNIFENGNFIYDISSQDLIFENNNLNINSHNQNFQQEDYEEKIISSQINDIDNSSLQVEIILKNQNNILLGFKDISKPSLIKTIVIRKLSAKLDEERKSCLKFLIREYTDLIINMLDEKYKVSLKFCYSDYYKEIKKYINTKENSDKLTNLFDDLNFSEFSNNSCCEFLINNIIEQIDKNIFYKFHSIKEELKYDEINEIRNKIFFTEDFFKEILEMINFLISN
jgi:hypothetical protein